MRTIPIYMKDLLQHAVSCAENEGLLTPEEFDAATDWISKMPTEESQPCKPSPEPPTLRLI